MSRSRAKYEWLARTLPALSLAVFAGCGAPRHGAPPSGGASKPIGEIHLFSLPTALTVAGSSVAGGVGVRIYASETGGAQTLLIERGRLDILMFDQPPASLDPRTQTPLKVWSFTAADLAPFKSVTMMGTGYQLELTWGLERPKGNVFTVVARYRGADKTEIYSTPAAIAVATH